MLMRRRFGHSKTAYRPERMGRPNAYCEARGGRTGWLTVPLNEEGVFRLRDIELVVPDFAANGQRVALGVDGARPWGFDGVLVDSDATTPKVRLTVADVDGAPLSKDPHYHRGSVKVSAYIEDRWFEARRAAAVRADVHRLAPETGRGGLGSA